MTDYLDMATKWLSGSVVKDIDGGHVDRALASLLEQVSRDARKAERERIAKHFDARAAEHSRRGSESNTDDSSGYHYADADSCRKVASAIRALPTTEDEDANRS